ncbi:MAG: FAD-dependent thymidylate synthase, partial [Syntrophaceae bacterium]|nr:FAD-dependent thymidylate synthase [Syntrophaceae bacterium]
MKVILAGYNIDHEVIRECGAVPEGAERLTPETLCAAYARISRNPLPVDELRAEARSEVEKARRSNRTIVFEMGHSSIAEHAVFNVDILDVSRLAVEEIEKFRLCSYTEKSQRYIRLEDDFV